MVARQASGTGARGDRFRSPVRALELRTNLRSVPHSSATMRELFDPLKRVFGLHVLCMVMSWNALFSHIYIYIYISVYTNIYIVCNMCLLRIQKSFFELNQKKAPSGRALQLSRATHRSSAAGDRPSTWLLSLLGARSSTPGSLESQPPAQGSAGGLGLFHRAEGWGVRRTCQNGSEAQRGFMWKFWRFNTTSRLLQDQ